MSMSMDDDDGGGEEFRCSAYLCISFLRFSRCRRPFFGLQGLCEFSSCRRRRRRLDVRERRLIRWWMMLTVRLTDDVCAPRRASGEPCATFDKHTERGFRR